MSLWMLFVLLALIKLPLIGLMLWMPFRNDEAVIASDLVDSSDSSEEDGGSHTLPAGPIDPHPRMPLPAPHAAVHMALRRSRRPPGYARRCMQRA